MNWQIILFELELIDDELELIFLLLLLATFDVLVFDEFLLSLWLVLPQAARLTVNNAPADRMAKSFNFFILILQICTNRYQYISKYNNYFALIILYTANAA